MRRLALVFGMIALLALLEQVALSNRSAARQFRRQQVRLLPLVRFR